MDDLISALENKDIVKIKRIFTEAMEQKKQQVLEARKIEIGQSVVVEGEEKDDDDDNDSDDDDNDDDDDQDDEDEDK